MSDASRYVVLEMDIQDDGSKSFKQVKSCDTLDQLVEVLRANPNYFCNFSSMLELFDHPN